MSEVLEAVAWTLGYLCCGVVTVAVLTLLLGNSSEFVDDDVQPMCAVIVWPLVWVVFAMLAAVKMAAVAGRKLAGAAMRRFGGVV